MSGLAQEPATAIPAQSVPPKYNPTQAAPAQTAPAQPAPAQPAPAQAVPAQTVPAQPAPAQTVPTEPAPAQTEAAPAKGKVLFQREEKQQDAGAPDAPATPEDKPVTSEIGESSSLHSDTQTPNVPDADITVSDEEREAVTFTAYDLDLHLTPASAGIEAHANFTVRNDGKVPLTRITVQLSSTLVWESLRLRSGAGAFVQHRINTDADHTGTAREAVLTLPAPLAPGASVQLTAIYSGSIPQSGERLARIGAPEDKALEADWDTIATAGTALRGYGDVLWYPTAGAPVFLGDGAKLFDSVGRTKLRQQAATTRLRLTVNYTGDAPDAAYFDGRRQLFTAVSDNDSVPVASGQGVATAEFAERPLGFRVPSLFVTDRAATTTDGALMRAVTDQSGVLADYVSAAEKVQPLLIDWLGDNPLAPLDVIDHDVTGSQAQPFEDGTLLVTPLRGAEPAALAPVLVHTLAHSWFASSHAWLDEGVAQFMSLLWVETNDGRQAGLDRLQAAASTLALAEPDFAAPDKTGTSAPRGQSLIDASSDVYYRTKAAAVLWMLRSISSDEALKQAFQLYRKNHAADAGTDGFQQVLEQTSHKDLKWFFDDWVYHDRGLPDLSIAYVSPRELIEKGGKSSGWLVAISVRNDGAAAAEVPVTVRSGTLTATERLLVPGKSNAATRILFQQVPEEVVVGDGTVPEVRESVHVKRLVAKTE